MNVVFFHLWSVINQSGNVKNNGEDVIFGVQTWNVHTIAILEIIIKMFVKMMHVDYAKNYTTAYAKGVEIKIKGINRTK